MTKVAHRGMYLAQKWRMKASNVLKSGAWLHFASFFCQKSSFLLQSSTPIFFQAIFSSNLKSGSWVFKISQKWYTMSKFFNTCLKSSLLLENLIFLFLFLHKYCTPIFKSSLFLILFSSKLAHHLSSFLPSKSCIFFNLLIATLSSISSTNITKK